MEIMEEVDRINKKTGLRVVAIDHKHISATFSRKFNLLIHLDSHLRHTSTIFGIYRK